MDKMPSTQFRNTYSTLTSAVEVTVNGHAIGTWLPSPYSVHELARAADVVRRDGPVEPGFNTHPFTPVPKKGK